MYFDLQVWFHKLLHHKNFGMSEDEKRQGPMTILRKKNCETIFSQQGILNQIICKCYTIYLHRFSNKTTSKLFLEDLMSALLHTIFALPRFGLTKVLKIVNKPFLDNLVKLTFLLFFNP